MRNMMLACLCLTVFVVRGTNLQPCSGAPSVFLGGSGLMTADAFSAVNNCSRMPFVKTTAFGISLMNMYVKDIHNVTFCTVLPAGNTAFGIKLLSSGNGVLSNTTIGAGCAHRLHQKFSFGMEIDYHVYRINAYGSSSFINAGFACYSEVSGKLACSFHIYNPLRTGFRKTGEKAVSVAKLGCRYKINSTVSIHTELNKPVHTSTGFSTGVRYDLNRQFYFGAGFSALQGHFTAGFGICKSGLDFACASVFGRAPGSCFNISISYELDK